MVALCSRQPDRQRKEGESGWPVDHDGAKQAETRFILVVQFQCHANGNRRLKEVHMI